MNEINTKITLSKVESKDFLQNIQEEIISSLKVKPLTFSQLLKRLNNCDPLFAKKALDLLERRKVINFTSGCRFQIQSKAIPQEQKVKSMFDEFKYKVPLCSSPLTHKNNKNLINDIKHLLPEASPVYFQWWFHDSIYPLLSDAIISRINFHSKIALIGATTLGAYLSRACNNFISVFDIDKTLLKSVGDLAKRNLELIQYDVFNEIDSLFKNKFSLVYLDPPWYLDTTLIFLKRAMEVCENNGYIFVSLPPLNTRETINSERYKIKEFIFSSGVEIVGYWPSVLRYDVPIFENRAYCQSGIKIDYSWRSGDLILLRKSVATKQVKLSFRSHKKEQWDEFILKKCRFFIRNSDTDSNGKLSIEKLPNYKDFYLKTTSLREPGRKRADMITSRNHCAIVKSKDVLSELIRELSAGGSVENIERKFKMNYGYLRNDVKNTINTILHIIE